MVATEEREINFYGELYSIGCPACNRVTPQPPALDVVYQNGLFRVHQDYELPIPGMMVIETVRHIRSIDDFTDEEVAQFGPTLLAVRRAMRESGIQGVATLVQEEKSSHFHAWFLPMEPWMQDVTLRGKNRDFQPIFDHAKAEFKTPEQFQRVEDATRRIKVAIEDGLYQND